MSSLRIYRQNAIYELHQIESMYKTTWPMDAKIRAHKKYCDLLQTVANVGLLSDVSYEKFSVNLLRAAESWLFFLQENNLNRKTIPVSYVSALHGALICGDVALSKEIANCSSDEMISPEYSDEFLHGYLLKKIVLFDTNSNNQTELLSIYDKYMESLSDLDTSRAEVFLALIKNDTKLFAEAMGLLNDHYQDEIQKKLQNPATPPAEIDVQKKIWLEGIALLKLADQLQMTVSNEYELIPYHALNQGRPQSMKDCLLGQTKCPL